MSNFGCAVNGNLAAMVANPGDLVSGREAGAGSDPTTGARAIESLRSQPLTGAGGLKDISTKSGG
jgi:pilus assembly protein CpaD